MAKAKRRGDAPYIPPLKRRRGPPTPTQAARTARLKAIVQRTRDWIAKRDAFIADVDLSDLEAFPTVFYPTGIAPKAPGLRRAGTEYEYDEATDAIVEVPERPPIAPPVPYDINELCQTRSRSKPPETPIAAPAPHKKREIRCNDCGEKGHNRKRCPDKIPPEEWDRIDREIARGGRNITQLAKRLNMDVKTLRGRIKIRAEIRARRGSAALPGATAA